MFGIGALAGAAGGRKFNRVPAERETPVSERATAAGPVKGPDQNPHIPAPFSPKARDPRGAPPLPERERAASLVMVHDQTLQILALIQHNAGDARAVRRLAAGQRGTAREWR